MALSSCTKVEKDLSTASSINYISGDNQSSTVETLLSNSVVVAVRDQNGDPFRGIPVNFLVTEGSVSSSRVTTDLDGKASVSWTLGSSIGSQQIIISAFKEDETTELENSPITINASGTKIPKAESIELVSGDSQTATAEFPLLNPIEIAVKDKDGMGFSGIEVKFDVDEGSVSSDSASTDEEGKVSVFWTLGPSIGNQTLLASALMADGTALNDSPINITAISTKPFEVGEFHAGGIIFYVSDRKDHGLVCAAIDQSTDSEWGCDGFLINGALGIAIGKGEENTASIEAECLTTGTAADFCANLDLEGYSDWFLPSIDELYLMYFNKSLINATAIENNGMAFDDAGYWSSTQVNLSAQLAKVVYFDIGFNVEEGKDRKLNVRAVREF